jgi:branched-chain amino acid transport system ATP-binding protein
MATLEIRDLDVSYGKIQALRGLSLSVDTGEIVALLGNNGAGKTTTLNTVSGLVRATSGSVHFNGRDLRTVTPWDIVASGLVQVPEGRRIFSTLTVHENLQIGGYTVSDGSLISKRIDEVYELLPRLKERRAQQGGTLSGGEQQMLAIGRALVTGPKLLMLDEPSMGLAPQMVGTVMKVIRRIAEEGTTVLLVEQNARAALKVAHRGYVIENGRQIFEGSASDLIADPRIVEAYLGA